MTSVHYCCPIPIHLARYQLIYACGVRLQLPGREERVNAVQALLRVVSRIGVAGAGGNPGLTTLPARVAVLEPPGKPGAYSGGRQPPP